MNRSKILLLSRRPKDTMVQWCNPQSLQQDGQGLIPSRAPPLELNDKWSQTQLALSFFCDPNDAKAATSPSTSFLVLLLEGCVESTYSLYEVVHARTQEAYQTWGEGTTL